MKGWLTSHVLDLSSGLPAEGVKIELYTVENLNRKLLIKTKTNKDGRTNKPFLEGEDFIEGTYEFLFFTGKYFRNRNLALPEKLFLDVIPIQFGVSDPGAHYHIPLLVSPYGYSTYRGS